MRLLNVILLSLFVALMAISLHQIITVGFKQSYWILMLALVFLFAYALRRKN